MATIIVKTEVEATPALVVENLRAFAAQSANMQFPYPAGTALLLKPEYITALGAVDGMPVLVMTASKGTPLGMIAIHLPSGDVTAGFIAQGQVLGVWSPE